METMVRRQQRNPTSTPQSCLPTSFDDLDGRDMACVMSQLNSEPRPKLMGLSPIGLMKAAMPGVACALMDALGIEDVGYGGLDLTVKAIDEERGGRGLPGLI